MQKAVRAINADSSLSQEEKARRIQALFSRTANAVQERVVEERQRATTLTPCAQYKRNCDIHTPCCDKWYGCRLCHDEAEVDHTLDRTSTQLMRCRLCHVVQPVAKQCQTKDCAWKSTRYFCERCRLWEDNEEKKIFHCDGCRICRIGKREDYWHCDTCDICWPNSLPKKDHKCVKDASRDTCVCGEYMHSSNKSVIHLPCGHVIHSDCRDKMVETGNFACPKCRKSMFRNKGIESAIRADIRMNPMPQEFRRLCQITCNDCHQRSIARMHWLGVECRFCGSFNSSIIHVYSPEEELPDLPGRDTDVNQVEEPDPDTDDEDEAELEGDEQDEEEEDEDQNESVEEDDMEERGEESGEENESAHDVDEADQSAKSDEDDEFQSSYRPMDDDHYGVYGNIDDEIDALDLD